MRITWQIVTFTFLSLVIAGCGQPFTLAESEPSCDPEQGDIDEGQFVPPPSATVIVPIPKMSKPDGGLRPEVDAGLR